MKLRFLFILSALLSLKAIGQNHPPFPSIEEAYNWIKSSDLFKPGSYLQKEYKIKDLSQAKLKKIYYDNWDTEQPTYFYAYSSSRASELYPINTPKDRCETSFIITTPKEADGTYYDVPVRVVYSRLNNDVLTNTWEKHFYILQPPYLRGGKGASAEERENLLIAALKKFKPTGDYEYTYVLNPEDESDYANIDELNNCYQIDSITYQKGRDYVKSTTEQTWYYVIKGQKLYYDGDDRPEKHTTCWLNVETTARKGKNGWEIVKMYIRNGYSNDWEDYQGPFLATFAYNGFDAIYRTKTEVKPNPLLEFVSDDFMKDLHSWLKNLTYSKEEDIKAGAKFFDQTTQPEEAAWQFIEKAYEAKEKLCDINFGSGFSLKRENKGPKGSFFLMVYVERDNCNWTGHEDKKKKYKAAGMSSAVLKSTGGHYQGGYSGEYHLAIIDGNWCIVSGSSTFSKPIPW